MLTKMQWMHYNSCLNFNFLHPTRHEQLIMRHDHHCQVKVHEKNRDT